MKRMQTGFCTHSLLPVEKLKAFTDLNEPYIFPQVLNLP